MFNLKHLISVYEVAVMLFMPILNNLNTFVFFQSDVDSIK